MGHLTFEYIVLQGRVVGDCCMNVRLAQRIVCAKLSAGLTLITYRARATHTIFSLAHGNDPILLVPNLVCNVPN